MRCCVAYPHIAPSCRLWSDHSSSVTSFKVLSLDDITARIYNPYRNLHTKNVFESDNQILFEGSRMSRLDFQIVIGAAFRATLGNSEKSRRPILPLVSSSLAMKLETVGFVLIEARATCSNQNDAPQKNVQNLSSKQRSLEAVPRARDSSASVVLIWYDQSSSIGIFLMTLSVRTCGLE